MSSPEGPDGVAKDAHPQGPGVPAAWSIPAGRLFVSGVAAANLFAGALIAAWLGQGYRHQLDATATHALNVSHLLSGRLAACFERTDLALLAVSDEAEKMVAVGALEPTEMEHILTRQRARAPDAISLRIIDQHGLARFGSPAPMEIVDVSDREFFAALRDDSDAALHVSGPFMERIIKAPVIFLSRRISGPNHSFAGVVNGSIELARLSRLLSTIDVGPSGIVTLRWADMSLVATNRQVPANFGSKSISSALQDQLQSGRDAGTYEAESTVDGVRRVFAFAKVEGYPLLVVVGLGRNDALRDWWRQLGGVLVLMVCFMTGSVAAVVVGRRTLRHRDEFARVKLEQDERLRESEERFRTAFATSPDAVTLSHLETGAFSAVNDGFTRITGWTKSEVLGRTAAQLGLWEEPEDRALLVRTLSTHGTATNVEARFRTRTGGSIDGLVSARLLTLRGEPLILTVSRDISDWKRGEEERTRLREQVQQTQKLESIGQLAGGVAHDFNNLLTVILSCAEGLRSDLAEGRPTDPESVEEIASAGQRARDLTKQLLAFARKQVFSPECLDLNVVVHQTEKLLRRTLGEDITMVVRTEEGLWPVWCDPVQIGQVLLNLAVNARDAMPDGGTLSIETYKGASLPADTVGCGEWVTIALQDTGVGMSPEVQKHLFEPFFTTKPPGKGTGMGLATVHGIVSQSGGCLRVESQPGKGTRFEVCLPRTTRVSHAVAQPSAGAKSGTETVLVVEDDPHVRSVTVRALVSGGYRVLEAQQASEALEIARRELPLLDLLVTDVVMPGASGHALAEELRRARPDLRVLFVSGYAREAIPSDEISAEGTHFFQKPFTAVSLLECVRVVLDKPRP